MGNGRSASGEMLFRKRLAKALSVNPHLTEGDDYQWNCQSCAIAFEAQMRGIDAEAVGFSKMRGFWADAFEAEKEDVYNGQTELDETRAQRADVKKEIESLQNKYGGMSEALNSEESDRYLKLAVDASNLDGKILRLMKAQEGRIIGIKGVTKTAKSLRDVQRQVESWGDGSRGVVSVCWKGTNSGHIFNVINQNGKAYGYDGQNGRMNALKEYVQASKAGYIWVTRVDNLGYNNKRLNGIIMRRK